MIQNNGVTLDLLLGLTKTDSVGGQVAATEMRPFGDLLTGLMAQGTAVGSDQPLFAAIMNGLGMADTAGANELASPEPGVKQPILAEMFALGQLDRMPRETATPAVPGLLPTESQPIELTAPVTDLFDAASSAEPMNGRSPRQLEDLMTAFTAPQPSASPDEMLRLLSLASVANPRVQAQTTGLPEGTYQILTASVVGDRLQLTLQPAKPAAEPIQVSLPLSIMNELSAAVSASASSEPSQLPVRVALHTTSADTNRLADLLSKLNLRELQVESHAADRLYAAPERAASQAASRTTDNVLLTFRGGAAQPFSLGIPVDRRTVLTHVRPASFGADSDGFEMTTSKLADAAAMPRPMAAHLAGPRVVQPTTWPGSFTPLHGRPEDTDELADFRPLDMAGGCKVSTNDTSLTERLLPGQVRFTLPEQLAQQLKPNGRSISIAIEPEHLGKATLRLSISNQLVTARLTVDTPAAKAMVEQSLDQLTQQLARAGVKIDLVNVNVAGGDAHTNLFGHRQQSVFDRPRQTRKAFDASFAQNLNSPVTPSRPTATSYVGPSGVNVYA